MNAQPSDFLSSISAHAKSVAINNAAASGDLTVHTSTAGRRFVIYHIWLQAEGVTDVTFKSGSTAISGAIAFAANADRGWISGGVPILRGNAVGDNFVITISAAVQVNGFALVGELAT